MLAAPKGLTGLWPVRIIGEPKTCELLMVITRFVGCSPDRRAQDASPRHADRSRRYLYRRAVSRCCRAAGTRVSIVRGCAAAGAGCRARTLDRTGGVRGRGAAVRVGHGWFRDIKNKKKQ